jgi:HK97 family phage major capsid protein
MAKIFELQQARAGVTQNIRALMDKFADAEMTAEDKQELARMEAEFDGLNAKIATEQKQLDRERAAGEIADQVPEPRKNAVRELFAKALTGDPQHMTAYKNELKLTTDAAAGYLTAPVEFVQDLIKGLDDFLFMRQISKVVGPIGAAQSLGFPSRTTGAADATWVSEITTAPEEASVQYGRREFKPNKMAKLIKMSRTLIQHAPMAENVVLDEMRLRIANGAENAYLNGNGTAQPLGIFTANAAGINTDRDIATGNTTTTVTFDGLQEAKYALKQQYHANASWVMHRDLCKMIAKIKDGEGQYAWQGSMVAGQPDRLLGHPVFMSEFAPNTYTNGLYVAVIGDFRNGYWICDANGVNVQVLRELYAATNQIGYLVDYFGDGAPVLPEAFARVTLAP